MEGPTSMQLDSLIDVIERGLATAPPSFEAIANGGVTGACWWADRMPESWIVACVMNEARLAGIAAIPEVRVRYDIEWFETGGAKIQPNQVPGLQQRGAKIDLILGDKSSLDGHTRLRVAMEIKGPKSNPQQFRGDIERIHELQSIIHDEDQALIFAYVTCQLTDAEQLANAKCLEQSTGLTLDQFRILPASRNCVANDGSRSYVYLYVIRGTHKSIT